MNLVLSHTSFVGLLRQTESRQDHAYEEFSCDISAAPRRVKNRQLAQHQGSRRTSFTCFAVALWNDRDPILKERLFGLSSNEGNHGEDVKECYFYLDSTPTHSYMKFLYKYPQREFPYSQQREFPYSQLTEENRRRSKSEPDFELFDQTPPLRFFGVTPKCVILKNAFAIWTAHSDRNPNRELRAVLSYEGNVLRCAAGVVHHH